MSEGEAGWLGRLRAGLGRTANGLTGGIDGLFNKRRLDADTLTDLEDLLIMADLGVATAGRLAASLGEQRMDKEIAPEEVRAVLAAEIATILAPVARPLGMGSEKPHVVLVAGVNGSGKTTTIGKLAAHYRKAGLTVMLAACDTFRAAATEQLQIWGERTGCPVITAVPGADAAGLAYEALEKARAAGADLLFIDTAGRLQNRKELMAELTKILRVLGKLDAAAPHSRLLVLDATVGQNAHSQVETFAEMIDISGLVLTKLDGTAKGGVLVALAERFGLPVHAVCVGEGVDDLQPFDAETFARALLGD